MRWPLACAVLTAVLLGFAVLSNDRAPDAPSARPVVSSFWSVPVTGGRPRLLIRDRGDAISATYRRGGRSILFARSTSLGSTALFSLAPGGRAHRLRSLPFLAQIAYSPATDEIAVQRGSAIVAESLSSGRRRVLAQVGREQCCAVFSADGSTLVFTRMQAKTNRPEFVVVRGGRTSVFPLPAGSPAPLALSPRGDQLVFAWGRQLFLLNTRTGHRRLFASDGSSVAAWSPDGQSIAYLDRGGLVTRNLVTNRTRLLVSRPVNQSGASFSLDGQNVVYVKMALK